MSDQPSEVVKLPLPDYQCPVCTRLMSAMQRNKVGVCVECDEDTKDDGEGNF